MHFFRFLALSGSLRQRSTHAAVLRTLQLIAPPEVNIILGDIRHLPLYNADIKTSELPALRLLEQQLRTVDGLIIASPQMAQSVSAPMKNALDWLAGCNPLHGKPVMLIHTEARHRRGTAALQSVLQGLSAELINEANAFVPTRDEQISRAGTLTDESHLCQRLRERLAVFCTSLTSDRCIAPDLSGSHHGAKLAEWG